MKALNQQTPCILGLDAQDFIDVTQPFRRTPQHKKSLPCVNPINKIERVQPISFYPRFQTQYD